MRKARALQAYGFVAGQTDEVALFQFALAPAALRLATEDEHDPIAVLLAPHDIDCFSLGASSLWLRYNMTDQLAGAGILDLGTAIAADAVTELKQRCVEIRPTARAGNGHQNLLIETLYRDYLSFQPLPLLPYAC
jgi:hypothetical protein